MILKNIRQTISSANGNRLSDTQLATLTQFSELRKVLFVALSVTFLFVYEISREPLNGFAPNSHGRHVWSLARMLGRVWRSRSISAACVRFMFEKKHLCSSVIDVAINKLPRSIERSNPIAEQLQRCRVWWLSEDAIAVQCDTEEINGLQIDSPPLLPFYSVYRCYCSCKCLIIDARALISRNPRFPLRIFEPLFMTFYFHRFSFFRFISIR